ncbi:Regulator of nonsense transcripts 3A-like protein [Leptotrombidium deliense]|uniref:Regulator of nonsense transcripts 3A-like protein n=1 Tax=Leptotrombidium deliense TaxID=299467 RepID=A0A443SMT7_9ACAR|nr:Regulator of nonsense transcripts 3A-like protein [Leptotrombidium deliense]
MVKEFISRKDDDSKGAETAVSKAKKDKKQETLQTKVVVRHLPPTMNEEQFVEQVSPIPEHNFMYFAKADLSLGSYAFSRAYINFIHQEDIFIFKDKFDGYVFVDVKGNEYPAIVEFAPYQKIPRRRVGLSDKRDTKSGTLEQDSEYVKFLESLQHSKNEANLPSAEVYLEEIEARDKELKANHGCLKMSSKKNFSKEKHEEEKCGEAPTFTVKLYQNSERSKGCDKSKASDELEARNVDGEKCTNFGDSKVTKAVENLKHDDKADERGSDGRRLRNKDRPTLEIYRPGARRIPESKDRFDQKSERSVRSTKVYTRSKHVD